MEGGEGEGGGRVSLQTRRLSLLHVKSYVGHISVVLKPWHLYQWWHGAESEILGTEGQMDETGVAVAELDFYCNFLNIFMAFL